MSALFIIAHAPLATAFRALALHAYADAQQRLVAYDVPSEAPDELASAQAAELLDGLLRAHPAGEVLLLTDVFGATPFNIARRLAEGRGLRLLVGLNVPMLWRALNYADRPIDELCLLAMAGANQGVMQLSDSRPQNQAQKPAAHDPNLHHHQQ